MEEGMCCSNGPQWSLKSRRRFINSTCIHLDVINNYTPNNSYKIKVDYYIIIQ